MATTCEGCMSTTKKENLVILNEIISLFDDLKQKNPAVGFIYHGLSDVTYNYSIINIEMQENPEIKFKSDKFMAKVGQSLGVNKYVLPFTELDLKNVLSEKMLQHLSFILQVLVNVSIYDDLSLLDDYHKSKPKEDILDKVLSWVICDIKTFYTDEGWERGEVKSYGLKQSTRLIYVNIEYNDLLNVFKLILRKVFLSYNEMKNENVLLDEYNFWSPIAQHFATTIEDILEVKFTEIVKKHSDFKAIEMLSEANDLRKKADKIEKEAKALLA